LPRVTVSDPASSPIASPAPTPAAPPAPPPPSALASKDSSAALSTSVTVYIKLSVKKNYNLLATLSGKRDNTRVSEPYDVNNAWWDNPLVAYRDAALPSVDVTGGADAQTISGKGVSKNVTIDLTLVPHADIAVHSTPKAEAMQGSITLDLLADASYFNGSWTPMLNTPAKTVTFTIDTREPNRPVKAVGKTSRSIPVLSLERYIRDNQKWEPKTAWPTAPPAATGTPRSTAPTCGSTSPLTNTPISSHTTTMSTPYRLPCTVMFPHFHSTGRTPVLYGRHRA
jgi:hypothetical protein